MTDDSSVLPVFAYVEEKVQICQLRKYLASLGAPIVVDAVDDGQKGEECNPDLIQELVEQCAVVGAKLEHESEVEMTLNSLVSLIVPLPSDKVVSVVQTFCEQLSGDNFRGPKASAAVRVLSNLFHGFGDPNKNVQHSLQYDIYCSMLRVAAENSGLVSELPTDLDVLREWFTDWQLDTEKRRECLRLLHKAFRGQQSEASSKVMLELLRTYTERDAANALADAKECVRSAIGDPGTFLFDHLLYVLPVQCLERDEPKMYRLLNIFVSGSLHDFRQFYESDKAFVSDELALNYEELLDKMRILTLMTVGEQQEEVGFDELSEILDLNQDEELEEFVIRAVQSKAIIAKMDQVHKRLRIGGVKNRRFERPQWEQLCSRLDAWAANLRLAKSHIDEVLVPG